MKVAAYDERVTISRWRTLLLALLALTAVCALTLRPIGIEAFGIPPDPAKVEIVGLKGSSEHCVIIADCETVLTANANVDLTHSPPLPVIAGFVFLVPIAVMRPGDGPQTGVSNPPPRVLGL